MLLRTWLVIALIGFCGSLFAQADSLETALQPDSIAFSISRLEKADIEAWLDRYRGVPSEAVFSSAPLQADYGDLYHAGYFYIGRPDLQMPSRHGFEQLGSAFSASLYHGMYHSIYAPGEVAPRYDYDVVSYPFVPALTVIHGGLGDWEHRNARVSFRKGELLGYNSTEYQGDLLVQKGSWTDINAAETSMKHYLSAKSGLFTFEAEYANWEKDIAMNELLPVYWLPTNFKIPYSLKHYYAAIKHPWLELKVIQSKEQASYTGFAKRLEHSITQMNISHTSDNGVRQYKAAYERTWQDATYQVSGSFDQENYQDKLSFAWDRNVMAITSLQADWLDWKRVRLSADVSLPLWSSYLGGYARVLMGDGNHPLQVQDIYNQNASLDIVNQSIRHEAAAYLRYEWLGLSALLAAGIKNVKQETSIPLLINNDEQPFVRLALDIQQNWRNWELLAKPYWVWTKAENNMCESPEFRFQSVQNLLYHLPYNNSLVAGFGISGHSGYYAANAVNPFLIEASTALDLWGGFNIDRYFEFRAGLQNAMSTTIYGSFPTPTSLYADIRWFYLN